MTASGRSKPGLHPGPGLATPAAGSGPSAGPAVRTIVLIGNPNTGKSTLFGALSGLQQRVGNYPGVTVEKRIGQFATPTGRWMVVDLPGTYSLAPRSLDEMVAVDVLLGRSPEVPPPDVIVCVVAADNLERNLYLVSQVLEMGRPTIVAVTMLDVAASHGLVIDLDALQARLGVPVIPVQAHRRRGLDRLKEEFEHAFDAPRPVPESPFPLPFRAEVDRLDAALRVAALPPAQPADAPLPRYLVERLLLDVGGYLENHLPPRIDRAEIRREIEAARGRLATAGLPVPTVESDARYTWVARVAEGVVTPPAEPPTTPTERIDALLTHRLLGTAFLTLILLLIFHAVFTWAAGPMDGIEAAVGAVGTVVERVLPEGPLRSLLVQGVIGGVGAVVVFLPQILILFFFLGVLEDCGYLARAAYLVDRFMAPVGLSGKSFIPLLSSFACAVPGIMATRVIENRRDRLTTILIAPLMSCSARLPVYTLMIGAFVPQRPLIGRLLTLQAVALYAMYALGIVTAGAVAFLLKRTALRGERAPFVMELPSYKWPSPRVVLFRMVEQAWEFVYRAGTLILAVSIVMWAALYYPRLSPDEARPLLAEQQRLEQARAVATERGQGAEADRLATARDHIDDRLDGLQKRRSLLGRLGHAIEPAVRPLGWDWRLGCAVLASFPAREVVISTLGVIFDVGEEAAEEGGQVRLRDALRSATWERTGRPLFNTPVALSVVVFFALCAQCVSTLAIIRRETNGWTWPLVCFVYMTVLAYVGALLTYQLGRLWI